MNKNKSNGKQKQIIQILLISFMGSLFLATYHYYSVFNAMEISAENKVDTPKYFDYGSITNNSYCNDFFSFRMPICEGHEGKYKEYDFIKKGIYEKDSVPVLAKLTSEINNTVLLLITEKLESIELSDVLNKTASFEDFSKLSSEKRKRELVGSDYQLVISAHQLKGTSLNSYLNKFENLHNPEYGGPKMKSISGVAFREYIGKESQGSALQETMYGILGGTNRDIISYNTEIHGFALSIDLFYQTDAQKDILMSMVDQASFH